MGSGRTGRHRVGRRQPAARSCVHHRHGPSVWGIGVRVDFPVPSSALAIVAHPDDAEFQCGATLAKWSASGTVVSHLICTDGSKGTWDVNSDQARLVATRQTEQRAAAAELGATGSVIFLGWPDGELDSGLRQRSQVAYWIRKLRPAVVLGHDPWKRWRLHPDHRNAGWLACDGVVAARDPFFFPEHDIAHHRPNALLLFESDEPDLAIDVAGFAEHKTAALLAHESQFETTHDIVDASNDNQRERFSGWVDFTLAEGGETAGFEHAELFKVIDDL
ncbi:MAG: PIG-L family deacetylase [Actinomycetia bacterium]|nr:PIG-L family deacetylase [Actinomycetes bacterium]